MAIIVNTNGIFDEVQTGTSKNTGKPWMSYNFRAPQNMNGVHGNPEQMNASNLRIFPPRKPSCDFSQLVPGVKYALTLGVQTTGNLDLLSYREFKQP